MTVFEYLQQLPQSLFEATLMGLMGIPFNPIQEAQFHEWMNSSYEKTFNAGKSIDPRLKQKRLLFWDVRSRSSPRKNRFSLKKL